MIEILVMSICAPPRFNSDSTILAEEMERRRRELPIKITTGLGSDVDRYASLSPTLIRQVLQLKKDNWKIVWGASAKGSETRRKKLFGQNIIIIDSQFNTGKSYDIAYVTSALAHEAGHASNPKKDPDTSSFAACMDSFMLSKGGEADAIINQLTVHAEILNASCIDIFAEGREADYMKKDFVDLYNQGIKINNMQEARLQMAQKYLKQKTSNSNQTYEEYYGDYCKKHTSH